MLLAVYIPEQEPQVGHELFSQSSSSASSIAPRAWEPTASNIRERLIGSRPSFFPASIGPPETKIEGMLIRAAAISIPGTILSQFGTKTNASKGWALAITSIESAISSRLTREYFIPVCPMAIPSQTPITGKATGFPPPWRTPLFTASTIRSRWMCPGMISLAPLTTPMIGIWISESVQPSAFINDLWGARCGPSVICAERRFISHPPQSASVMRRPISFVPTSVIPPLMMSAVRYP